MRAAVGLWVLSAVICVGRGHHHLGHSIDKTVQDTVADGSANSVSLTDVDKAFQMFLQRANDTSQEEANEGTAVFVDNNFKPKPDFLQTLKQSYFADGFNVDFAKTKESADTINKYVQEKTNGKIDKLVELLDPNIVMCLISYIYYKGKWATQFDPRLTKQGDFNVDETPRFQL
ncbi:hypothetical protein EPR50_G00164310 [Perca flavescens]|uniref:Thyroxine-binding globulin n=1 Tax=Perca flavescens TaxID=8167 RepID=A0A484CJ54_PERFV|nr:hypothetical protein EPR50_G00164310 [Perca flavescens]